MRVLVVILIAFFVLSAGTAVIVYIYDHFNGSSVWKSQIWQTWKTPLIIFAVVIGLALLTTAASLSSKKYERAEKEFALAQGWGYSVKNNDPEGVIQRISTILERVSPEKKYDVNTVMTVQHEKGNIFLFGCWYNERGASKYKLGSASLIVSERLRTMGSQVNIVPRTGIDSALTFKQVDMGDPEFARNYIVSAREPGEAVKVINGSMKAMLVDYWNSPDLVSNNFEIDLGPGGVVILRWAQVSPEEWLSLLELTRRLESTMR